MIKRNNMKTKMTTPSNNNVKKTTKTQQSPNMIQEISLKIKKTEDENING